MKRRNSGGSSRQGKTAKQGSTASLQFEVKVEVSSAFIMNPFLAKAMDWFDARWTEHEDLRSIMAEQWPNPDDQRLWAQHLDTHFPPQPEVTYLSDWGEPGKKFLRPYMWAWVPSAGNKGAVSKESFRHLFQSIVCKGFVTDVMQPGIELPIISRPRPELAEDSSECPVVAVAEGKADAYSVHEIKGWSRACAMHLVIAAMTSIDMLDEYKTYLGDKIVHFQTQQANYMGILPEGKDEIDINRGQIWAIGGGAAQNPSNRDSSFQHESHRPRTCSPHQLKQNNIL